ncbi:MAG: hypothetical protein O2991_00340, partial [Bacteroidetes bacterium]|nr:hypothetical protein [Bacteroidota bacterium]
MTQPSPSSRRAPIDVFGDWATQGKDQGMETGHARAVSNMLDYAIGAVGNCAYHVLCVRIFVRCGSSTA